MYCKFATIKTQQLEDFMIAPILESCNQRGGRRFISMKTTLRTIAVVAVAGLAIASGATVHLQKRAEQKPSAALFQSAVNPQPLKAMQNPNKATEKRVDILVDEDFSLVPNGEITNGMYSTPIANHYVAPGRYMNPNFTKDGTWEGSFVWAGNDGTVVLQTPNPQDAAYLATPLGDYSGKVTVTAKVRAVETLYPSDDGNTYSSTGSDFDINAKIGGYDEQSAPDWDGDMGFSQRLYPGRGWSEVEYTFTNNSADNDGWIKFSTEAGVEIDWIKITVENEFIAAPKVRDITDFNETGFTINWDPVRYAYNYYVDLWKKEYVSEEGATYILDCENQELPEGWTCDDYSFATGVGNNGSTAILVPSDTYLESPNKNSRLLNAKLWLQIIIPEGADWKDYQNCDVFIECLGDAGWEELGYLYGGQILTKSVYMDLNEETGGDFAGKYYAVRVIAYDMAEDASLAVDDFEIQTDRESKFYRVYSDEEGVSMPLGDEYDDDNYNYYATTYDNKYTFTNLDPTTEYFYRVRSHFKFLFSKSTKNHAFAVAAPVAEPASEIKAEGTYTANWDGIQKATRYGVTNYGIKLCAEDAEKAVLTSEHFSKAKGADTLEEMTPMEFYEGYEFMDEYTDMPGWLGKATTYGNGMVGVEAAMRGSIMTPPLMLNPYRGDYYIRIQAVGTPGDYLALLNSVSWYGVPFDEEGVIDNTFVFPSPKQGEEITISSYNNYAFALKEFTVMQDVKAGDRQMEWLHHEVLDNDARSFTFTGLDPEAYSEYGYMVKAYFDYEGQLATSLPSDLIVVDLKNGSSMNGIGEIAEDVYEVARYTIGGVKVARPVEGINIVRYSDGSVRKEVVK